MAYAEKTQVPIDRSQAEIRKILAKYGATGFAFGEQLSRHVVMFEMAGRRVRFILPLPDKPNGTQADELRWKQVCRSRWRSLTLAIKAKLECVDAGIATLEEEFLANIMLPNGSSVSQVMIPQIDHSYKTGKMPPLLGYDN